MNIQVDSITEVKKKLTITVEDGHVQEHIDEAYKSLQKSADIPGFRKGKTPRALLEKKFGPRVQADVFQDLMRETMTKALEEKKLDAIHIFDISKPEHEKGKGMTYQASVEIRPNIDLTDYKGLTLKKNVDDVKDENIQDVLVRIQDSHAIMKPVEATTPIKGQYASVVFEQLDKQGNAVEKETPEEQLHMVGHESAIKEIDTAIAKLSLNETTIVQTKETTGKDKKPALHVRITLKGIKNKEVPTIDDAFAKTAGPFQSLDELKNKIKEDLTVELEEQKKVNYATQILDQLCKNHPAPLPETLLEQEMQNLRQEFFNRVVQSGQSLPENFSMENMEADMKPEAERRVHEQIILSAVAKAEDITVDAKTLEDKIHELAHMYNKPVQELFAELEKNNRLDALRSQILSQKTLDFLLDEASIK